MTTTNYMSNHERAAEPVPDGIPDIYAIQLAWELGYQYAVRVMGELADDVRAIPIRKPTTTVEERVQKRIRDMERWAAEIQQQIKRGETGQWRCSHD